MQWLTLALMVLKLVAALADWRARREGEEAATARLVAGALDNAMAEIERAKRARLAARAAARRDPAGILRDDDGFRRD